ncbi:MAG: 2-oxoacid:acceptor oxidoreductase subunit alpha [Candidatus Omnitrophica bacterium]|nr:2-oxoacid:acceptor oxidoreductase subunit alpha [Candidatus Omnitrophota bacterium]
MAEQKQTRTLNEVTIRFAGDSGDGMQLTGLQFTDTAALIGNDISTLPDFPAEIRAPAGTLPGVSGFQINFSDQEVLTPGDRPDVLVAMNPAALKVNLKDLAHGATIIANQDSFTKGNLDKAGYDSNPLDDGSLAEYQLISLPITTLNNEAVKDVPDLKSQQAERCKNFFALGVMFWMFDRPLDYTLKWIDDKFAAVPSVAEANRLALKGGYNHAQSTELLPVRYKVSAADLSPGTYRRITGNEAMAIGLISGAERAGLTLFYGSYPITPASEILQDLSRFKEYGVKTFQAEDEIAAVTASIGASFGGNIGVTGTSGPGLALKSEAIGLAVMTELPLVIIDVQRGGPSTGLPTKPEQGDLLQALIGRNSECPAVVIAPASPGDCFWMATEAVRLAVTYMTPVFVLSDAFLANASEPWKVPVYESLPKIKVEHRTDPEGFYPYLRNKETLARPWVLPGTPGLEHRIGGLEKEDVTGNVSYDPLNHQKMVEIREAKIQGIAKFLPDAQVYGHDEGDLLVLGWGSTYGAILTAVDRARERGLDVSCLHLRYLNPFPKNLGELLGKFKKVLIPEMNLGQLALLIRAKYLVDAISYPKVQGKPFLITEIVDKIEEILAGHGD